MMADTGHIGSAVARLARPSVSVGATTAFNLRLDGGHTSPSPVQCDPGPALTSPSRAGHLLPRCAWGLLIGLTPVCFYSCHRVAPTRWTRRLELAVTSASKLVSCCCRGGGGRPGGAGRGDTTRGGDLLSCCMLPAACCQGTQVRGHLCSCSPGLQPCSGGPTNARPLMSRSSLTIGRRQTLALGRAQPRQCVCLLGNVNNFIAN